MAEGSQIVTTNDRHLFHIRVAGPWRSTSWAMWGQSWCNLCISLELFCLPWATVGNVGAILGLLLGVLGSTWVHLGGVLGYVGGISGLSWGFFGLRLQHIHQTSKTHTSLKCLIRVRSAPVERECNVPKQRCHRASHSHTSLESLSRSRSTPVERKRTNLKPYPKQCSSHIENTYLIEIQKSFSLCPCRARMHRCRC